MKSRATRNIQIDKQCPFGTPAWFEIPGRQ